MFKKIIPILLLFFTQYLFAQKPEGISISDKATPRTISSGVCSGKAKAGTTTRTLGIGAKTNDKHFLCANDSLVIVNNGNSNLSEDPNPATIPGIAYLFYKCPPTVTGPHWSDIKKDPCLENKPINAIPPFDSAYIARGKVSGDINFVNDGSVQSKFNGRSPVKYYFAPFTLYDFFANPARTEGDTACVNVNVADGLPSDTFSVVYLNAIVINNLTLSSASGTFTPTGGLPEYDGSNYTITIIDKNNPANKGTITGVPTQGNKLSFTVPTAGDYVISVKDGKSCDAAEVAHFPIPIFKLSDETVRPNDTACVRVSAINFTNIGAFQFIINYDVTKLAYIGIKNANLSSFDNSNIFSNNGKITVSWNVNAGGITTADNSGLFDICFKAIGPTGTYTPVVYVDTISSTNFDVYNADGVRYRVSKKDGSVTIIAATFQLKLSADSTNCNKDSTGQLHIVTTGAGAPFTYSWVNTANALLKGTGTMNDSTIIKALPAGIYNVTVTSNVNEQKTATIEIKQPASLFLNPPKAVNPLCFGDSTGSLTILANSYGGGTPPYRFLWSNNANTIAITKLPQGNYACTITDAKGCTQTTTGSIGVTPITLTNKAITVASCIGVKNGSVSVSAGGGTSANGNYKYQWSNGQSDNAATTKLANVGPGIYRLTISDDNSCSRVDSFTVNAARVLVSNAIKTDVTCKGFSNGFISVNVTATGTSAAPYTFNWSLNAGKATNTGSSTVIKSLGSGIYTLNINDGDKCSLDTSFTVKEPDSIKIDTVYLKNVSCNGNGSDGEINVKSSGGTPFYGFGYRYQWSRTSSDTLPIISNLKPGNYTVTVTDSAACSVSKIFTVTPPVLPRIDSISITKAVTCFESTDGILRIFTTPAKGTSIKSYNWDNGGVADSIINLGRGVYNITITDSNNCSVKGSKTLGSPNVLSLDTLNDVNTNPSCPKAGTGIIALPVKGGTAPYSYSWSGGPNTSNSVFGSLKAGNYTFTVTDANNCKAVKASVTLSDPPSILIKFANLANVSCYGKCEQGLGDGKATAIASGGTSNTGKYSFTWVTGEKCNGTNTCDAKKLCSGYQSVFVTDNNCSTTDSVFIGTPDSFSFRNPIIVSPSCFGLKDGSAEIRPQGGTGAYKFVWSTGSASNSIVNVSAGTYSVLISDANSCTYNYSIIITQPDQLKIDTVASKTNDVSCHGLSDGQIGVQKVGGNAGSVRFIWSNNVSTTDVATNLKAGTYSVTMFDSKGCGDSLTHKVLQPDPIFFFLAPVKPPHCNGDLTSIKLDTAFGGTYNHQFSLSVDNGPQYPIGYFVPVFGGQNHVLSIVEQFTNCSVDTTISVPEPPAISITFNTPFVTDNIPVLQIGLGDSVKVDSTILKVSSSLPLDSISWTPNRYLSFGNSLLYPTIRPLNDTTYKLTITDVNGCTGTAFLSIELQRNRNVYVPYAFSPNDDDVNDFFGPFAGAGVRAINFMRIFDRWGELVFSRGNFLPNDNLQATGWDGKYKGTPAAPGVYVYLIEVLFEDGQTLLYRGDLTLVR